MPGPTAALKLLGDYLPVNSGPIRARDILVRITLGENWESDPDLAAERAEKWEPVFLRKATEELSALNRLGRYCNYAVNSSSSYLLQGAAFCEPRDSHEVTRAKRSRARFSEYVHELRTLSPSDFELLCVGILRLLGVGSPSLTRRSGDEGIDFFGRLDLESHLAPNPAFVNFVRQMSVWLIGQAKHYTSSHVSTPDLRDLVGAIELAKSQTHVAREPQLGVQRVRLCDPIHYLFFTTGRISGDAWTLIDRSGIVSMDGEMIAAFLADNDVGVENDHFSSESFRQWLQLCE